MEILNSETKVSSSQSSSSQLNKTNPPATCDEAESSSKVYCLVCEAAITRTQLIALAAVDLFICRALYLNTNILAQRSPRLLMNRCPEDNSYSGVNICKWLSQDELNKLRLVLHLYTIESNGNFVTN